MPVCADILAERIAAAGPISFRDFMEIALYESKTGYYVARAEIGAGGDFVTAPTISPLFARAVARVFAADAAAFEGPLVFLEAAAAGGVFLRDFRRALAEIDPAVSARTRLWALERSERGREGIAEAGAAERIFSEVSQIPRGSISGWVFSNELYDALPVHRVKRIGGELLELWVDLARGGATVKAGRVARGETPVAARDAGVAKSSGLRRAGQRVESRDRTRPAEPNEATEARFAWTSRPAPPELSAYLARFGVELAEGQIAEINLEAGPLHRALCGSIRAGRIVSFDYGHPAPVLYHPHARTFGTLAVHSRGRRGGDPLERPGLVDLTAHVNWDDLRAAGEAEGFESAKIRRLAFFLSEAGLFEDASRDRIAALRLLDPEGLGDALSVLTQSKGV
ncbi:MAG: SAM-dependent methyltransferase [Thermoanaerobaculia bacterium]